MALPRQVLGRGAAGALEPEDLDLEPLFSSEVSVSFPVK